MLTREESLLKRWKEYCEEIKKISQREGVNAVGIVIEEVRQLAFNRVTSEDRYGEDKVQWWWDLITYSYESVEMFDEYDSEVSIKTTDQFLKMIGRQESGGIYRYRFSRQG